MLHAIKPMIWQALQTLKDPSEDVVRRSQLQVLSHNLSAEGTLDELVKLFDIHCPIDTDKVECKRYLDTVIDEAVKTLVREKSEKEQKKCVDRVHQVCWELCKIQMKGKLQPMLTAESTKIWWKIFNTFAERDSDNQRILYPVTMDWEEVDYWANVVLKVMALPTNAINRKEQEVMGSSTLNFQDALERFNAKLNVNNSMYVLDQEEKPDLKYIENSMHELDTRLFEGIHLSGSLLSFKKNHAHTKWCVLYQMGLAFADNPADVDSSNPKAFISIRSTTEVMPIYDKSQRPVRFQLKNGTDSLIFEANNISVRNKWITAIICLKHGKLPDYDKDFISRRKARSRNRQFDAETKATLRLQKEKTKKQVEDMSKALEEEKAHHKSEAERLRNATTEELRAKMAEHDHRMDGLMNQMTELGQQYEQEKATMLEQHERELHKLVVQHGDLMGSAQNEWEAEVARLWERLERETATHKDEIEKKDARIDELEVEVSRLNRLLENLKKEKEDSAVQHRSQLEQANAELASQQQANAKMCNEAEVLTKSAEELRDRIKGLEDQQLRWEEDKAAVERLTNENVELKEKAVQLEVQMRQGGTTGRKNLIESEIREEDQILHDIIFQQTGFNPQDTVASESVNDFNILTSGAQQEDQS